MGPYTTVTRRKCGRGLTPQLQGESVVGGLTPQLQGERVVGGLTLQLRGESVVGALHRSYKEKVW